MAKSKTRKGRRAGPVKTVAQVAAARAGKNFARMVLEKAVEGIEHKLTIQLENDKASTLVRFEDGAVIVGDPQVTAYIMTSLASLQQAAITLETYDADEGEDLRYVRCWLVDGGTFYPATAEEARESAEEALAEGEDIDLDTAVFRDAFRLA